MEAGYYFGVDLFLESLTVSPAIYSWRYDPEGRLLGTNCTHHVLHMIFAHVGCLEQMLAFGREHGEPLILSERHGLVWGAVFRREEGVLQQCIVIGPIFHSDSNTMQITEAIRNNEMERETRVLLAEAIRDVSVISSSTFFHLCQLLHFYVSGEKITRSDLHFQDSQNEADAGNRRRGSRDNRIQTWQVENALLRNVRDGDLNYYSAMERAGQLSNGVRVSSSDPILPAVVSAATFTGLCTRAAIDGGLTPDEAYTVGDQYVQMLLGSQTIADVRNVNHEMYEDFIRRVHRLRVNTEISPLVRGCMEYIETHLGDDLSTASIASHFGYARHYLSRKFKQEMKLNLSDYIRMARIDRAKKLLEDTDLSIRQIAEDLRFSSSSHFSDTFRDIVGELPLAYRKQQRRQ